LMSCGTGISVPAYVKNSTSVVMGRPWRRRDSW
jgi:hypothetical protein